MENKELIEKLKNQSTWKLLGLGVVTFGVYFAHYIKKQTDIINEHLHIDLQISKGFIISIMILSYASVALFIAYLIVDYGHPIEKVSHITDKVWAIMLVVWGFKARNRVNSHCFLISNRKNWFHGLWTFFFTPLYFNYKVNQLNASLTASLEDAD